MIVIIIAASNFLNFHINGTVFFFFNKISKQVKPRLIVKLKHRAVNITYSSTDYY